MNKQSLIEQGFTYVATQNSGIETEVWAKFTGWLDTIQYYYYHPLGDKTFQTVQSTSFLHIDMLAKMRDAMTKDFLKKDIQFDKDGLWAVNIKK